MRRVLDEIDALVEESLRDGEPLTGYDYDDPGYPTCPNPHCGESWHGLAITQRMRQMRRYGELDPAYDYHHDTSPVHCPGSGHQGEWEAPDTDWTDPETPGPQPDPAPDPRRALADRLWKAVARPATGLWAALLLLSLSTLFLTPAQWKSPMSALHFLAPILVGWLIGYRRRTLPRGYLRRRLTARPIAILALLLTYVAGWIPAIWARHATLHTSRDIAHAYTTLLIGCAVAALAHFLIQTSRTRSVTSELIDGTPETDRAAHGHDLAVNAFIWMMTVLAPLLVLGWPLSYLTYQPHAIWAAIGITTIIVLTHLLESITLRLRARTRDPGEILMITTFILAHAALLWWSLHVLSTTSFHP